MNPNAEGKRKGVGGPSILKFFKKIRLEATSNEEDTIENQASVNESVCVPSTCSAMPVTQPGPLGEANDIGIILKTQIGDEERRVIMENPWIPECIFKFPGSGARNLKFQYGWLSRWKWLLYSKFKDGAYCKYCSSFSSFGAGRGFQTLGVLVKKPFRRWKDAVEQFNNHENNEYHKRCILKGKDWLKTYRGTIPSVQMLQNTALQQQIIENRNAVLPIIETVLFCGRQGIPLRAHRDHGKLNLEVCPVENEGNFRALLRFRANSGDEDLTRHLETGSKNALYLSPKTQNEIISAINDIMLKKLVEMVNSAKCFTVLADEATDVSTQEQTSIGVRYLHNNGIREDFLQFVAVSDLRGKNLAKIILNSLREFGIDTKFLRGQGYDGASAMSGKFIGAQACVTEEHPTAIYVHCASHSLNLAISASCSVSEIRNCCGTATKLCVFFNTPKRMEVIKRAIEKLFPKAKSTRLKQLCPTRWVERHDSILQLQEMLPAVREALEEVSQWEDLDSASMASQLLCALQSSSFIISLQVMGKVFSLSLPLARYLQHEDIDLLDAMNMVNNVKGMIEKIRSNAEQEFATIFKLSETMAELLSSEIKIPRRTGRQTHRCNIDTDSPESYFRISIFLPFLDHFLSDLNLRFLKHEEILGSFQCLIPTSNAEATKTQEENLKKLLKFYREDIQVSDVAAIGELHMWYERVKDLKITSRKAIDFYTACHKDVFPTINTLLQILATLPVSTSSSERSFSSLRRLKTYLRSTTGQERLNGLAMLNIHRELDITAIEVLDDLAKRPRRLEFRLS